MIRETLRGVWVAMLRRCTDVMRARYAGRGIAVCARWRGELRRLRGGRGVKGGGGLALDRIDNDRGYWSGRGECTECRPLGWPSSA